MSDLTFSQSERRTYLGPILIAMAVLIAAGFAAYLYFPHYTADLAITHIAALPTHTEIQTGSKLVGHETDVEENLYAVITLRIDDRLHDPLFISDITSTLTTAEGAVTTTSAIEKNDLDAIYTAFPQIKPLTSPPLLRESTIPVGGHGEGMVILRFPITKADWDNRKSATLTVTFYHQGPTTIDIPKN